MRGSILIVLAPFAFGLLACSSTSGGGSDDVSVCDLNPEASVGTRRLATNGISLNSGYLNGTQLQSGYLNGIQLNAGYLNGLTLNGIALNGVWQNGVWQNGLALNGVQNNGIQSNGIQNNGVQNNGVDAAANELVGTSDDGSALRGDALVGKTIDGVLSDGRTIALVVDGFERSEDRKLAYYRLSFQGQNVCGDGGKGMFVPGVWDATAAHHDQTEVGGKTVTASFSCTNGVIAKCVVWGYAPWIVGAELHQTCTRMARADYCGNGVSFTKNGTAIDVFDAKGVQAPANESGFEFEAAWGPNGAACVARTRYDAKSADGTPVLPSCWSTLPRCSSLDEGAAYGATMANMSKPQSRTFCGDAQR